ncbi:MAG: ABC transporter ATP-binding protein [Acidimicrobiales bacterium]
MATWNGPGVADHAGGGGKPETGGSQPDTVISLRGVTKRFGSHTVLQDLTFDVPRGRISAVLGPSGTGKSVLLKTIIGLLRPESGQIYVDGEPIVGIRHKDMLRIRRKFGVLFQDGALFGSMDLFDNIAFPLREHTSKTEREIRSVVLQKAEMVGLVTHLPKLPGEISGGMRKRAGLARALVLDPEIVFFDEPDSGLDPVRVAYLDELVKEVQAEIGCTFFIITHNIESVKRTADYIGMLFRSQLIRFGPAEEMLNSTRPLVRQFLSGSSEGPISMDEMVDAEASDDAVARASAAGDDPPGSGRPPTTETLPAISTTDHAEGPPESPAVDDSAAALPAEEQQGRRSGSDGAHGGRRRRCGR